MQYGVHTAIAMNLIILYHVILFNFEERQKQ